MLSLCKFLSFECGQDLLSFSSYRTSLVLLQRQGMKSALGMRLKINFSTIRIFAFAIRTFHIILQPWLVFYRVQLHQGDRYCSTKITHYSFFHHHAFLPFIERAVVINRLRCTRFPCRKYQNRIYTSFSKNTFPRAFSFSNLVS